MNRILVFRGTTEATELHLQDGRFTKRLQGEHSLAFSVRVPAQLDLRVGDHLEYKGEVMELNAIPDVNKVSRYDFRMEFSFQGLRHRLGRWILDDEGAVIFPYTASLDDFMAMFLESLSGKDSGWALGDLESDAGVFTLEFDCTNLWDALNMIAEGAGCEWQIIGKSIHVKKTVGQATAIKLSVGKDNGLYSIARKNLDGTRIVNTVYGIGGDKNLPQGYPFANFMLSGPVIDQASIDAVGVREGYYRDEEIYPKRVGTVTGIGQMGDKRFSITDTSLDFDLNGQRIQGQEAKIVFHSGALNGQEFKILDYKHVSKTVIYEANTESNGDTVPYGLYRAEIGDEYSFIGIRMPSSYVDAAVTELEAKSMEYLNSNKIPRVLYDLDIDVLDSVRKAVYPNEGDLVNVVDEQLGIDEMLRVTAITHPALFPFHLAQGMKYECEVGNDVSYSVLTRLDKGIKETRQIISQISRNSWEADRRNIIAINEFREMVFDPDGNLQQPMMEALVAYFGTPSQLFDLVPAPTFTMAVDGFTLSATTLIHKAYEIVGLGYIWDLPAFSQTGLDEDKAYYLSAKCSRTTLTGEWVLSESPIETDSEVGYWHFNLGVLSSVIEGERSFRATKGFTLVSGGQIETDMITAYMINVVKLFAQEIEATNLSVTGDSKIGNFSIDADGLVSALSSPSWKWIKMMYTGFEWHYFNQLLNSRRASLEIGKMGSDGVMKITASNDGGSNAFTKGMVIDMVNGYEALEVMRGGVSLRGGLLVENGLSVSGGVTLNGNITVGGSPTVTGAFQYSHGSTVYEFTFKNGLLIGQRLIG